MESAGASRQRSAHARGTSGGAAAQSSQRTKRRIYAPTEHKQDCQNSVLFDCRRTAAAFHGVRSGVTGVDGTRIKGAGGKPGTRNQEQGPGTRNEEWAEWEEE
jgi:hypothetical protein